MKRASGHFKRQFNLCYQMKEPALVNDPQERAGVKMILIQDGSQPPNIDKPLRIIGDPYKVQVPCQTGRGDSSSSVPSSASPALLTDVSLLCAASKRNGE